MKRTNAKPPIDHDGKSQTSSAVDARRYPAPDHESPEPVIQPTHEEISERAKQLWIARGRQPGSQEQDWLDAERELGETARSRAAVQQIHEAAGSVQR